MKYSLRSVMIVVTLAAVGTGVVVAWHGHRTFCLERATLHRSKVVKLEDAFIFVPGLYGSNEDDAEITAQFDAGITRREKENASHHAYDSAYQHAIWRPWERFWIDDSFPHEESSDEIDKAKAKAESAEQFRRFMKEQSY